MQVEVISEQEEESGLKFSITFGGEACTLSLSWADYNLWSPDGTRPPSIVAVAVLRVLLEHGPEKIPASLDASVLRRLIDGGDQLVSRELGSGSS
ncbi:MAG: hypothetical protein CMJ36_05515 [Phycisphaerae bacterium]|nr:hypothetical protein [Phycisphaerae bacterium]